MKINLLASLFNVVASVVSGLLLLPIIQQYLGIEAYGYTAVALSFINISTIVSVAITSMAARYISIAMNKGNTQLAQKYFSTVLLSCGVVGLMVVFLFLLIALNVDSAMNVEFAFKVQVQVLLVILSLSFFCTLIKTPFVAGLYFTNQLCFDYLFLALSQLARVIFPLVLFQVITPYLWVPYIGALLIDVGAILFYLARYRVFLPNIQLSIFYASGWAFKQLISSGIWVSLTKAGAVLMSTITLYFSNILFTSYDVGVYASIVQLQNFMAVFTSAIVSLFIPSMYADYTKDEELFKHAYLNNQLMINIILSACFVFVAAWSVSFLQLWTSEEMSTYVSVILMLTIYPAFTYPFEYMNQLFITKTYVKFPAIATVVFGFLNVGLVFIFCVLLQMDLFGLALAQMLSVLLRNYLVYLPIAAHLLGSMSNCIIMLKQIFRSGISSSCVFLFAGLTCWITQPANWLELIVAGGLSLAFCLLATIVVSPKSIREQLVSFLMFRRKQEK